MDPVYWVSYEFCLALFANAKRVVGGENPLFRAGEGAAMESFSRAALVMSRIWGVGILAKQVTRLNARFNRTKVVTLVELTKNSAVFQLSYYPEYKVSRDICNWNIGIYTGITKMTGATGVRCEEVSCAAKGAEHCVFRLTWKETNFARRVLRWGIRLALKGLVEDYEGALKDRQALIDKLTHSEKRYQALFQCLSSSHRGEAGRDLRSQAGVSKGKWHHFTC